MNGMNVDWKIKGLYNASAEKVYSEITALGDSFSPEEIVEAAKDETSELHKCFDWDDEIAAQKWRLHTARMIVNQLVVHTVTTDNEPVVVRVIESTSKRNEYAPTVMILKSETEYGDLLKRAYAELKAFQAKYEAIKELREIFVMIETLEENIA